MLNGTVDVPVSTLRTLFEERLSEIENGLDQKSIEAEQAYQDGVEHRQDKIHRFMEIYFYLMNHFPAKTEMVEPGISPDRPYPTIYVDSAYLKMMKAKIEEMRSEGELKLDIEYQPHITRNGRKQDAIVFHPPVIYREREEVRNNADAIFWAEALTRLPKAGKYTIDVCFALRYGIEFDQSKIRWTGEPSI